MGLMQSIGKLVRPSSRFRSLLIRSIVGPEGEHTPLPHLPDSALYCPTCWIRCQQIVIKSLNEQSKAKLECQRDAIPKAIS